MADSLLCLGAEFYDLGKEVLGSGASVRLRLRGWSMYPLVRNGDMVELIPASLNQVQIGDIVLFRADKRLLAHRIVRRTPGGQPVSLVPRGDNLLAEDRPIKDEADLVGQVRAVWRNGREIRLDRGPAGYLGRLIARHTVAHYSVYGLTRLWLRGGRLMQSFLPPRHRSHTQGEGDLS
jgi:signal peptidase